MVLRPKTWESRSPPGLQNGSNPTRTAFLPSTPSSLPTIAGWSSPVARQAHNLKVVGSNPTPATKLNPLRQPAHRKTAGLLIGVGLAEFEDARQLALDLD